MRILSLFLVSALTVTCGATSAKGIYLRHGAYVNNATRCGEASNATLAYFDGRFFINQMGFQNARPVKGKPNTFVTHIEYVRDEKVNFDIYITILNDHEFSTREKGYPASRYRYCPQASLPQWWRGPPPNFGEGRGL
jgi:hypothetical protein